jgi:hypothetical protein
MCTKSKTEIFIEKAKLVHGDKYGYSLVEYVNAKSKVLIICDKHFPNGFLQSPNRHLCGSGCMKCGLDFQVKSRTKTVEKFIEEGNLRYDNKFDYTEVEYINAKIPVKIICPIHFDYFQVPEVHLTSTHGCPKCGDEKGGDKNRYTLNEFIDKANLVHDYSYDYSQVMYVNNNTKVKIICPTCGIFEQLPSGHLDGHKCYKCAKNLQSDTEKFIQKSEKMFPNKFEYFCTKYVNCKTKVDIFCKEHDKIFSKQPNNHFNEYGCDECGKDVILKYTQDGLIGWTNTNWIKSANNSKNFDSFKVYIIKCWNDDVVFYKIGKTFVTMKSRFSGKNNMPYKYKILKVIEGDGDSMSNLERVLQKMNKDTKYLPSLSFGGRHECYSELCEETLKHILI